MNTTEKLAKRKKKIWNYIKIPLLDIILMYIFPVSLVYIHTHTQTHILGKMSYYNSVCGFSLFKMFFSVY